MFHRSRGCFFISKTEVSALKMKIIIIILLYNGVLVLCKCRFYGILAIFGKGFSGDFSQLLPLPQGGTKPVFKLLRGCTAAAVLDCLKTCFFCSFFHDFRDPAPLILNRECVILLWIRLTRSLSPSRITAARGW